MVSILIFYFLKLVDIIDPYRYLNERELFLIILIRKKKFIGIDGCLFWSYYIVRGWLLKINCKFISNINFMNLILLFSFWMKNI